MLDSASAHAMIAVKDLSRADEFYGGKLGLKTAGGVPAGAIRYEAEGGTWFLVYQSEFAGTAKSTCIRFEVEDIEAVVTELRGRGVVFEEYELPGVKTIGGIARHESGAGRVVEGPGRKHPSDRPVLRPVSELASVRRRSRAGGYRC